MPRIRLTTYAKAAGCAAKACQKDLIHLLDRLPKFANPNLLFGYDAMSDAGVYALDEEWAIVQTVDVLTPIADDPYTFGSIAAANSLSDIYAMGAKPLTALNILSFPPNEIRPVVLREIIRGGSDKVKEASAVILGGHTIRDSEIKYGLAVTGIVKKNEIISNQNAQIGDVLVLTKPIGTGIIATALKQKAAPKRVVDIANKSMRKLNKTASILMKRLKANAATDVTGYGLLGHALNLAKASRVGLAIFAQTVPILPGARQLVQRGFFAGGSIDSFEFVKPYVKFGSNIDEITQKLLCDAQTSGGLLITINQNRVDKFIQLLHQNKIKDAKIIGKVIKEKVIYVN
uniref:Selenide, water dikinase n=1 Tax=candidate division WOR-3 bacterium TaxID=2052148 RepID=A0A7C6A910_UNCW3